MKTARKIEIVELSVPKAVVYPNKFRVPKRQWSKWPSMSKRVFNDLYETMARNQEMFLHPSTDRLPPAKWKTTCWNAAWTAADAFL